VNFVASTLMNGAWASRASLLEISVFPTPVGPDHQDVLRQYLVAQFRRQLLPAPTISQGDRHCALGVRLSDNETIKFGNDFAGREEIHIDAMLSMTIWSLV
jgi:hypothetical protein